MLLKPMHQEFPRGCVRQILNQFALAFGLASLGRIYFENGNMDKRISGLDCINFVVYISSLSSFILPSFKTECLRQQVYSTGLIRTGKRRANSMIVNCSYIRSELSPIIARYGSIRYFRCLTLIEQTTLLAKKARTQITVSPT